MDKDARDPASMKIFPRNLSARADYVVAGNPVTSRPESGVDNTHPGLEFDARNIDRGFFPGLQFDFQFKLGARLSTISKELSDSTGLSQQDVSQGEFFLWFVRGLFGSSPGVPTIEDLFPRDGYEVLRQVRDLEPGELAVVVGGSPQAVAKALAQGQADPRTPARAQLAAISQGQASQRANLNGTPAWTVFVGKRADYLDADGVIEPDAMEPGELTQSLCSPWQWDFADCGCYYWAASRPDIVMGERGTEQNLNYQREDRSESPMPPQNMTTWGTWMRRGTIEQPQMILRWGELPVVVAEKERSGSVALAHTGLKPPVPALSHDQIVEKLTYLATVEHALVVQYLYAHYSVAAPVATVRTPQAEVLRQTATLMFSLARDEMQHLRWVNIALNLLDAPASVGCATVFKTLRPPRPVQLLPLEEQVFNAFIEIEQPSIHPDPSKPPGLYIPIFESLDALLQRETDESERYKLGRAMEIVSLLVDEGIYHYDQLNLLKQQFLGLPPAARLRVTTPSEPSPNPTAAALQRQAYTLYRQIVMELCQAYQQPAGRRSGALQGAVGCMSAVDAIGNQLANMGVGLMFTRPCNP